MKVLVIVVNYYCEPLVYSFVNGVLAQRFTGELRVLIVDNNSTPSRVVRLSDLASDDRVEVLSAGLNLGYFGAARFALKHYLGSHKPPDWTILSNPDITFPNLS